MCEDNKSPYKIWNTPTRCLLSLYVFFVSHNPFEMVTRSHPGPDPAQNQQLNCFAAHLSALSSIRAFTSRDGVSNDLSCNSSIFDHSRLLMLLRWLRFMLNLNDCLRKKEEIKKKVYLHQHCRLSHHTEVWHQWLPEIQHSSEYNFPWQCLHCFCKLFISVLYGVIGSKLPKGYGSKDLQSGSTQF